MGSCVLPLDLLRQHLRHPDGELVALAPHLLDQDRHLELAAPEDEKLLGAVGLVDAHRQVIGAFLHEAVAEVAAGDVLALAAGHRRVVYAELHAQRGLVDAERLERLGVLGVGDALAEADAVHAADVDDLARAGAVGLGAREALVHEELRHLGRLQRAVAVAEHHPLARLDFALHHAADRHRPEVGVGLDVADEQLKRRLGVALWCGHGGDERVEDGPEIRELLVQVRRALALLGDGEDDGKLDLVLVGAEVDEEVVHLVQHLLGALVGAVDLVDDDDGRQPERERFAQDEARLRQRALGGVHEQHHGVHHAERALDLAAEVRVTRRVDDVDLDLFTGERAAVRRVADGRVLGHDGDALLALEVHRVHDALGDLLVVAEGAALPQQLVDEGGLAVVDVGDDGDVAEVGLLHGGGRSGGNGAAEPQRDSPQIRHPPVRAPLMPGGFGAKTRGEIGYGRATSARSRRITSRR